MQLERLINGREVPEDYGVVVSEWVLLKAVHFEPFSEHLFPVGLERNHFRRERVAVGRIQE